MARYRVRSGPGSPSGRLSRLPISVSEARQPALDLGMSGLQVRRPQWTNQPMGDQRWDWTSRILYVQPITNHRTPLANWSVTPRVQQSAKCEWARVGGPRTKQQHGRD